MATAHFSVQKYDISFRTILADIVESSKFDTTGAIA